MSTTAQSKKETIISELVEARKMILEAASSLPPEKRDEVFLGIWSVRDLLAHLAGWDFTNLQAAQEILAGRLPAFYARYDHDWQTYNAELVSMYKRDDFASLLALVKGSHRRLIEFLQTIPADEFERKRGLRWQGHEVTIAGLLEVEAADERTHYAQIREFGGGEK
ncbi:MAG: DinB family protein [Chloroflexi bacterium]|nr:DinB family protein [Chloroflexota bacterium]